MIITDPHELTKKSEPFNFSDPQMDPFELAKLLVKEMEDVLGLGLSAIQIGIPLRVCVIRSRPKDIVLFNPVLVYKSAETETAHEGCLSFPFLTVPVTRAFEVRVRFSYPNQEVRTEKWGGLTARIVQHEMQHMDGETFLKGLSRLKLDKAIKEAKKLGFDYTVKKLHKLR